MTRIILTLISLFIQHLYHPPPSQAQSPATYYISPQGSDSNPGTFSQPFRSFSHSLSALKPGDTLLIQPGTYTQSLNIKLNGTPSNYITIKNASSQKPIITAQGQNRIPVVVNGSYINIQGIEATDTGGETMCVDLGGHHINSKNFIVHQCGGHGTYVDGQNILVQNHEIHHTNLLNVSRQSSSGWGSALKLRVGAENITLKNNIVYQNYGEGIAATRSKNALIQNNLAYDNFAVNIYIDNAINTTVDRNFTYCTSDTSFNYLDGAKPSAIAIGEENYSGWGAQLSNLTITNNLIGFCERGIVAWQAEVPGAGLDGALIAHNTLWGSRNTAISFDPSTSKTRNVKIYNNIIHQPNNKLAWFGTSQGITADYNFWVNSAFTDSIAKGIHDLTGNPRFATTPNTTNLNSFRLSSSSPAIGSALPLNTVTTDYFNYQRDNSPDMGALEFSASSTPPPPTPSSTPKPSPTPDPNSAPSIDFRINGSPHNITINSGDNIILSWSTTNADSCTSNFGNITTSGTKTINQVTATKVYSLTCTGPGGTGTHAILVQITNPTPPTPHTCTADINNDKRVDPQDYLLLVENFLKPNFDPAADLNSDSSVNLQDYFLLVKNFLKTCN